MRSLTSLGARTALVACLGLIATTASAQFSFENAVSTGVGNEPSGLGVGDLDGDGDFDLATTVDDPDRIVILTNNGGSFALGQSVSIPNSSSPEQVVAADFDGDGDTDMAVSLKDFNSVILVINNGGSFSTGAQFATGAEPRMIDVADFDGDGDLDMAVANREGSSVTVLTNNGAASFAGQTFAAGQETRDVAFADMDGDGDLDLAATSHDTREIVLFSNNGGSFAAAGTLSTSGQRRPEEIVAADFNGDGLTDLASATNGNAFNDAAVYLRTGSFTFSGPAFYPTSGQDTSGIGAADFDNDGDVDLVTRNESSSNLSVLPNTGAGAFGGATLLAVGTEPDAHIEADLDGDGDTDLAVANDGSNDVSIIINDSDPTGVEVVIADLDIIRGTLLSGGIAELETSDDQFVVVRSVPGFLATEPNVMEMLVGYAAEGSPATLDVTVETRINNPTGTAAVRLRNWASGELDQIGSFGIGFNETTQTFTGIPAGDYVRADGRVELNMKQVVIATLSAQGFDSSTDQSIISGN